MSIVSVRIIMLPCPCKTITRARCPRWKRIKMTWLSAELPSIITLRNKLGKCSQPLLEVCTNLYQLLKFNKCLKRWRMNCFMTPTTRMLKGTWLTRNKRLTDKTKSTTSTWLTIRTQPFRGGMLSRRRSRSETNEDSRYRSNWLNSREHRETTSEILTKEFSKARSNKMIWRVT